ncbi:unnamed protein product [Echinostoma caproni]|uniref:Aromatic-L-amino-acid decarboxylase n=1 Tax=Echinostoma caproni TaxID=27848 RepID=A0A183A6P1_9TREM|nr:unnamed protein product [Echinostoma caproni]
MASINVAEFRQRGSEMVQYVANYLEHIGQRNVFPQISPGYLAPMIPKEAPEYPESWEDIISDVERVVMPGMTHWQHPRFHAYFPSGTSGPSMCADILANGLGCIGFTWAHSSVERAGLISMLQLRQIRSNDKHEMTGEDLERAINKDLAKGLMPFFCTATLGTTGCCSFDRLEEVGKVCQKYGIWLHVDAAYAGSAFICPEYRPWLNGIEYAMSFVFNAHKWLLVNFDCSCVWFKEVDWVIKSFNVDPTYLKHKHQGVVPDFRHWHIPLGRKFRSLKLWFILRRFGVESLRNYIRNHINLAHQFESWMRADGRFEIVHEVRLAVVCFRLMSIINFRSIASRKCVRPDLIAERM